MTDFIQSIPCNHHDLIREPANIPPENDPKQGPGEVQLKHWLADEAEKHGVGATAIYARLKAGKYPNVTLRTVNARLIFVTIK